MFGKVLWGLKWMCPPQAIFSAWSSFSNSGHICKHPGCKSVPELSLWPQLSPFSFFSCCSAWLWEAFSFVPWDRGGRAALTLVCFYTGVRASSGFQHNMGKIFSKTLCLKGAPISFTAVAVQANVLRNKQLWHSAFPSVSGFHLKTVLGVPCCRFSSSVHLRWFLKYFN